MLLQNKKIVIYRKSTELGPRPHRRRAAGAASSLRVGMEHGLAGALDDTALLSPTSLSRLLGRLEGKSSDTGLSDPSHLKKSILNTM